MRTSTLSGLISNGFSSQRCPVTQVVMPNMTRNFEGFHVSYARHMSHYGCDTTALVLKGQVFFILNGYHADAMVEAGVAFGIQGCIDVFIKNIHLANLRSEHCMAVGMAADPFGLQQATLELIGPDNVDRIAQAVSGARVP